jgi:hypothetical protein
MAEEIEDSVISGKPTEEKISLADRLSSATSATRIPFV